MVEGHGVHRVAERHKQILVGRIFIATSPNGRFTDGAAEISNRRLFRIEAIGKNLFYFFAERDDKNIVVVHIHFGMSGRFITFNPSTTTNTKPKTKLTTRLVLISENHEVEAHLSAMTCEIGNMSQFENWCNKLGPGTVMGKFSRGYS